MNRQRILIIGLLISSLLCYLEWANESAFLFQVEYDLIFRTQDKLNSVAHPLIFIPLIGQLLLMVGLFTNQKSMKLTFFAIALISLLVLMILLVGILAFNFKIILSTFPFILLSLIAIIYRKKIVPLSGVKL